MGEWVNNIWQNVCDFIGGVFSDIETSASNTFSAIMSTANNVVEAIKGFFIGLKKTIISAIGEAIDWALGKLAELAAAVKSTPIIGGAVDYVTGGGGTTNNTVTSKYNVIVNTQAKDAEGTGRAVGNAMMGYNARMADGGVIS